MFPTVALLGEGRGGHVPRALGLGGAKMGWWEKIKHFLEKHVEMDVLTGTKTMFQLLIKIWNVVVIVYYFFSVHIYRFLYFIMFRNDSMPRKFRVF